MKKMSANEEDELQSDNEDELAYYEESSESEPEVECDLWDKDCTILPCITISNSITGRHLKPTCLEEAPKKKIKLCTSIRTQILEATPTLQKCYSKNSALKTENFEIINTPFKVCIINNLLEGLEEFKQELYGVDFNLRHMDLYEFFQSKDLKYLMESSEAIKAFYWFLSQDLKQWVASITGAELTHISATCSLYTNTDYLLVHDDQREDRMIAFILYLTDDWVESDGGALQLIDKDEAGQPRKTMRNLLPLNNQLVFFPVTNDSYHQVSEVTSLNQCRLSINGWFHTKIPPIFVAPIYKPLGLYRDCYSCEKNVDIDLGSWINEDYLTTKSMQLIQKHVEDNSEISLKDFFKQESFDEVVATLSKISWIKMGPTNRISYEVAPQNLPHIIERLTDLFQSSKMFQLLHKYTDLDLTKMKMELQRWTPGNYALLSDYNWKAKNELDLLVYFGCKSPSEVIGARTHYVTIEDEVQSALITIEPVENTLNLVYRDSARFTKYFSMQSKCNCFYVLICSYIE